MKNIKFNLKNLMICAAIFAACALLPRQTSAQKPSNDGSKTVTVSQTLLNDCSKALDELEVYDKLVESKDAEIRLLQERVQLEREKFDLMRQLAEARTKQSESLTEANNALKEAIAAKDVQLQNKDKQIELLKKKKVGFLTILKAIAAGVAVGFLL